MKYKQSIAFAHYKDGKLLGYRQDTFGTLGTDWAKIYTYSKDQVYIVLKNINSTLGEKKESVGAVLERIGADPEQCKLITKHEDEIYEQGQKARAFEVRVVKGPKRTYEKEFNIEKAEYVTSPFPTIEPEDFKSWLDNSDEHEVIETHFFILQGQLNLQ